MTHPTQKGRLYWQQVCTCTHQRGYHVNDGTGSCAGKPADGKACPCEDKCREFVPVPARVATDKMYGPVPTVADPGELVGKRVRLADNTDRPDWTGLVAQVFNFREDGATLCNVEWEVPDENHPRGRQRFNGMHYPGNLVVIGDG